MGILRERIEDALNMAVISTGRLSRERIEDALNSFDSPHDRDEFNLMLSTMYLRGAGDALDMVGDTNLPIARSVLESIKGYQLSGKKEDTLVISNVDLDELDKQRKALAALSQSGASAEVIDMTLIDGLINMLDVWSDKRAGF